MGASASNVAVSQAEAEEVRLARQEARQLLAAANASEIAGFSWCK